jgi:hypothetical protein
MSPAIGRNTQTYDLLLRYGYLQILDVLTTLAFLAHGVAEGNPVVQFLMTNAGSPLAGLAAVKVLAMLLGVYCQFTGRFNLLRRANVLFAGLVVWNLVALILSSVK